MAIKHTGVGGTAGFTLIEIMVAVTILGLLAAIAIPNYFRFMAKSRQTEAITQLGAMFVTEAAFFGEYSRYGSINEIGFDIAGTTTRYTYRSPAPGGTGGSTGAPGVDFLPAGTGAVTPDNTFVPSDASLPGAGTLPGFTATATGNLDGDATIDQWHVNDLKQGLDSPDQNDVPL